MSTESTRLTNAQLLDLTNQVAIVTGGGMGIGQAIALRLAEAGATVTIGDINEAAASETVSRIQAQGGKASAVRVDMGAVGEVEALIAVAASRFGRLDILVNNAGIFPMSPAEAITEALWDKVQGINLKGVFFAAQAAAKLMIAAGHGGRIINIASIDALHPTGFLAHYDASKGGVVMLTKSLALEYGRHGILVNAIAPGSIETPGALAATTGSGVELSATGGASPSAATSAAETFLAHIPLGRMGEPDDIAMAALFLASPAARYMTGSLLVVDGGYLVG